MIGSRQYRERTTTEHTEALKHIDGSPVVGGLVAKRREVAAQLAEVRAEARWLSGELDQLDAVIRMFRPDMPIDDIRPVRRNGRLPDFRKGELGRRTLEVLGEFEESVTARTVVDAIVEDKAIAPSAPELEQIQKNVTKTLWRYRRRGLVAVAGGDGGAALVWRLVDDGDA